MAATNWGQALIDAIEERAPMYADAVRRTRDGNPEEFASLGEKLCEWAASTLGNDYLSTLADGYLAFVSEVNRSQARYQRKGHYQHQSYAAVYDAVYNNPDYMVDYHWGVYTTMFAWQHHLALYQFFKHQFIAQVDPNQAQTVLDLGSGSGVWSLLTATVLPQAQVLGLDISETSVTLANQMRLKTDVAQRVRFEVGDATDFTAPEPFDLAMSCFLLEHLEAPEALMNTLQKNLKPGGRAWVTGALTAAEIDHIYEFRKESELIALAEDNSFRVIGSLSLGPDNYPQRVPFLPRSMAMVLEKRIGEWW